MLQESKCSVEFHDSFIEGICLNDKCKAAQKLICIECTKTTHALCNFQSKREFLQDLTQLKAKIQLNEQAKINKLELLKAKLVEQIKLLDHNITQNYVGKIKQIDSIITNPLTKQSWTEGYNLLSDKEIQLYNWDIVQVQLIDIKAVIDEMLNFQQSVQYLQYSRQQQHNLLQTVPEQNNLCKNKPLIIKAQHQIYCTALSPDGKCIASAGLGGSGQNIQFWDAKTGSLRGSIGFWSHRPITSLKYSPTGSFIVSSGQQEIIRVWDVETGNQFCAQLQGHNDYVPVIDITPDGKCIISGSQDKTIRFWDPKTGQELSSKMIQNDSPIWSLAIAQNNYQLAFGDEKGMLKIWDLNINKPITQLKAHQKKILCVNFSKDSALLLSTGRDLTIKIWNSQTCTLTKTLIGHTSKFVAMATFSPDIKYIVSGGDDKTVRLWDMMSNQQIKLINDHKAQVYSAYFSNNGKFLISAGCEKQEIMIQKIN